MTRTNSGHLSQSGVRTGTSRKTGGQRPQWRGKATVAGVRYHIAAWNGVDVAGHPELRLAFTPVE